MTWLDEDLTAFRELARSFCEKELAPHTERWAEAKQVDRELWTKAGEIGLLCLSIPEEYGGGGGTFAHEAVLLQEQARSLDDAWGVAVHNGIVAHYVLAYGTQEQKQRWLPRLASGELFVFAVVQVEVGHRPLALRQHGVEPPVEEDAETGVGELLPRGKVFRSRTVAGLGCGREREQRGAAQGAEMLHCLVR